MGISSDMQRNSAKGEKTILVTKKYTLLIHYTILWSNDLSTDL
jgi:hypothetical protein